MDIVIAVLSSTVSNTVIPAVVEEDLNECITPLVEQLIKDKWDVSFPAVCMLCLLRCCCCVYAVLTTLLLLRVCRVVRLPSVIGLWQSHLLFGTSLPCRRSTAIISHNPRPDSNCVRLSNDHIFTYYSSCHQHRIRRYLPSLSKEAQQVRPL